MMLHGRNLLIRGFSVCLFSAGFFPHGAEAAPRDCTAADVARLTESPAPRLAAPLTCNATLKSTDVIARGLAIHGSEASGLVLDCQGATVRGELLILSHQRADSGAWERPERITVRNCVIEGGVRVSGLAINGEGPLLRDSSRSLGHTERAQNAAPRDVLLENLSIRTSAHIPLYVSPGVTRLTLRNSTITGRSNSVAIYLDAESAGNTISGNTIDAELGREALAVDSSAYNVITNNVIRTRSPRPGGIYLYRNCGQGGTIRHQTPHSNAIVGNEFFVAPAIWVASRNGNRRYCSADDGYPFGSSASNLDFAQNTVICANHFLAMGSRELLKINDGPTVVQDNRIIYPDPLPFNRFVTIGTAKLPVLTGNDVGIGKRPHSAASCPDPRRLPAVK